jgi:hypothetical protein
MSAENRRKYTWVDKTASQTQAQVEENKQQTTKVSKTFQSITNRTARLSTSLWHFRHTSTTSPFHLPANLVNHCRSRLALFSLFFAFFSALVNPQLLLVPWQVVSLSFL